MKVSAWFNLGFLITSSVERAPVLEVGVTATDTLEAQAVHYGQLGSLWEISNHDIQRYPVVAPPQMPAPTPVGLPDLHWCTGTSVFSPTYRGQGIEERIRIHLSDSPEVRRI